ncbi:MAG: shikimate dehydrogenase [Kiritimatiellae bacterium]|nr:shikimate dehydrogenase [Kiritimatiellia bacterium]
MNRFAVIGHPVAHSLSPKMHAANFAAIGYAGEYGMFDVPPENIAEFVRLKGEEGYLGLNITIPHKVTVIGVLDNVDESVKLYGACNTVKFAKDGSISGYNTDAAGFLSALSLRGVPIAGRKVLVVGFGGAGRTVAIAALRSGAAEVFAAVRHDVDTGGFAVKTVPMDEAAKIATLVDIVVNATPVGLQPGDGPVLPNDVFRKGQFVLDIIPSKDFPPTAQAALDAGAMAADGLEFLVGQGAESFKIWTGIAADRAAMLNAVKEQRK